MRYYVLRVNSMPVHSGVSSEPYVIPVAFFDYAYQCMKYMREFCHSEEFISYKLISSDDFERMGSK